MQKKKKEKKGRERKPVLQSLVRVLALGNKT